MKKRSKLRGLKKLFELTYERDESRHSTLVRHIRELRQAHEELERVCEVNRQAFVAQNAWRQAQISERWTRQEQAQINLKLARLMAEKHEAETALRKSFGRKTVAKKLVETRLGSRNRT